MEKKLIYLILLFSLSISLFTIYKLGLFRITGFFVGFGEPATEYKWWNVSWHYRFKLEINSTQYSRTDWPIEQEINFTDLLPSGTFDENSTRVFEYNPSGQILYEVPSQFDKDDAFDPSSNAIGTLIFLMNGTTQANNKKIYYVYYDTIENGPKGLPSYPTNLTYSWDGQFAKVNNTILKINIDTNRIENTSGIYHVEDKSGTVIITAASSSRTAEYLEYFNSTHNVTFDLRNNATFIEGPVRLIIKQIGDEIVFGNPNQKTNEGKLIKKYYIYNKAGPEQRGTFIKILQKINNTAGYDIQRNSTPSGALAFDLNRTLSSGYVDTLDLFSTDPYSWAWGSGSGGEMVGVVNIEENGTSNFYSTNSTSYGRIGIQLNTTTIPSNSVIRQTSLAYFGTGGSDAVSEFLAIKDRFANPVNITQSLPERWYVVITPYTNATVYNRNETILVKGNISYGDLYNLTKYMNATFDMGTASQTDDQTIILYDDGSNGDETAEDKVFTNIFDITNDANISIWTINFTAYSNNSEFLNSTVLTFNVAEILNVTVDILNNKPIVGSTVVANIYVKNYRQDSWIAGATINCSYDSNEVTNKTDYNNGTYSVNFTTPSQEGDYILACNATKNGNFGNDTDTFTTEPAKTFLEIKAEPSNPIVSNVSLYYNDSFVIVANATNFGNGTAYSVNISLELLSGWGANKTQESCGEMDKNTYCLKGFNITVPNGTAPGNYYINVTAGWKNPEESSNTTKTQVNVTVQPNPKIDVEETKVSGETGDGIWTLVPNFTVSSTGNDVLQNITFSCISGDACSNFVVEFIPENISSLSVGSKQGISINVTVPLGYTPGTYNGTVNASAQNNGFDTFTLETIVPAKTNVSIDTSIVSYTANNITQQDNETFSFTANSTNIGNGSARFANITLTLPSGWVSNSSLEDCGNLIKNDSCSRSFNVTIPKATSPGNYFVNATASWTNPDNSMRTNKTSINVIVASNPLINVSETNVSDLVQDGTEKTLGNFTVLSIGNDALQNINFTCYSGTVCQNFIVEFIPASIPNLPVGSNQSVMINITVPVSYPAGSYNGTVNVSAANDKYKNLTLEVTVPPNRTWSMRPDYCEKSQTPPEGLVCEVNVTNLGNTYINFIISPEQGNYTKVNETSFTVDYRSSHVFSVTYNVTGVPQQVYNSTFIVDAVQTADPDNKTLKVSLLPYTPPIINTSIIPNETEQNSSVEIYVNVTDRSGSGIAWVKVNITRPDSLTDSFNMNQTNLDGNFTTWYLKYPNGTHGNTSLRGTYNVTVYARDNIGNQGDRNSSFLVYIKLSIITSTLSDKYYQGDTGSIYHSAKDLNNNPMANVNVTFTIKDPQQNITSYSSHQTNSEGTITPPPIFSITSDALLGNYSLISETKYHDKLANKTVQIYKNSSFLVLSRAVVVTGLFADIETAIVWYPDNIMKFGILIYNGEGKPVDPTSMNLTVKDPAGNLYFTTSMQQMTKQATGFYIYSYAMPGNTPIGMFLAVLNVSQNEFQTMKLKTFRVARGGPYDLWLQLLKNEVQQGDYLDFAITIDNKGEVSQDVNLEWWVSSGNATYYQESGWVYTPALSNQTITKQAYIFSDQPLGTYVLNVKMTYDSTQSPLIANRTFIVLTKQLAPNITLPTYPPIVITYPYLPTVSLAPKVTEKLPADILIERYRNNITLARGMTKIESVTVRNIGQVDLSNVNFFILGIPTTWFNITPESYKILQPDNSFVFIINFNIPKNVNTGEYRITLTAVSGVVSDQKHATITIFQSLEELLEDDIAKLKRDLQTLEEGIKIAEKEGKDTSSVLLYVDEIRFQINLAEENLNKAKTEDALANVVNARNLIDKARNLLSKLEVLKVERFFDIPTWMIFVVLIITILIITIFILWKGRKVSPLRPYIISLGRVVEKIKEKETKESLVKEREKLLRMLEVLEKEKSEGLVSTVAYKGIKKSIEEKLAKIEKKI